MKVEFVDSQREEHGVQPVLEALKQTHAEIAPSTYYAATFRPPSARAARDRDLVEKIGRVHEDNYGLYGARKVWAKLNRPGTDVARCTVERLMRESGLHGLLRDKSPRTTRSAAETGRPGDLVKRDFTATRVNELWVADITYVRTAVGWVDAAFVLDVFSRLIVGWQVGLRLACYRVSGEDLGLSLEALDSVQARSGPARVSARDATTKTRCSSPQKETLPTTRPDRARSVAQIHGLLPPLGGERRCVRHPATAPSRARRHLVGGARRCSRERPSSSDRRAQHLARRRIFEHAAASHQQVRPAGDMRVDRDYDCSPAIGWIDGRHLPG
ncbi:IS3 family transposase [Amycolatopsis alkalitolerans]|uniref:IS3 family transposase n=1 Tax=Amycolatopsis alkalitolerans TaxID=2547244 RepID=A0A5C4LWQ9_9PSEU|nr:IS3 family transposase [Amycolatopsis alkalitolerans]TNC21149.1 IS3 family transposase [Amycolatopsis alkalitolerans]